MIVKLLISLIPCLIASTLIASGDTVVFDGQEKTILYQTSSHAGQKQLQELLRMVPGGEQISVLKMPYSWKKTPAKIHEYPIIIARLGNHFNPPLGIKKAPINEAKAAEALEVLQESIADRLERDQPAIWVGINGHYHQRDGIPEGEALLASAAIFRTYQEQNTKGNVCRTRYAYPNTRGLSIGGA